MLGAAARDRRRGVTRSRALLALRERRARSLSAGEIYDARPPGVVFIRARTVAARRGRVRGHDGQRPGAVDRLGLRARRRRPAAHERARRQRRHRHRRSRSPTARRVPAHVVGKDEETDLAVLAVNPDGLDLHPLELGDSSAVRVGDPVVAIGNPNGIEAGRRARAASRRPASAVEAPGGYLIDDVFADRRGDPARPRPAARCSTPTAASSASRRASDGGRSGGFAVPIDTARDGRSTSSSAAGQCRPRLHRDAGARAPPGGVRGRPACTRTARPSAPGSRSAT